MTRDDEPDFFGNFEHLSIGGHIIGVNILSNLPRLIVGNLFHKLPDIFLPGILDICPASFRVLRGRRGNKVGLVLKAPEFYERFRNAFLRVSLR